VRAVTIPKKSGGERILGVPTVGDRIAQMVVKQLIEPDLDPIFVSAQPGRITDSPCRTVRIA
jgi:RNA-directed DNA polymerase